MAWLEKGGLVRWHAFDCSAGRNIQLRSPREHSGVMARSRSLVRRRRSRFSFCEGVSKTNRRRDRVDRNSLDRFGWVLRMVCPKAVGALVQQGERRVRAGLHAATGQRWIRPDHAAARQDSGHRFLFDHVCALCRGVAGTCGSAHRLEFESRYRICSRRERSRT